MLAALYRHTGGAHVLAVEEIERPDPAPGEVRVRLSVSGVNPTDYKTRAGVTGSPPDGFQNSRTQMLPRSSIGSP